MTLKEKSPKVVRQLLAGGFSLVGAGRGRLVFGKPGSPVVFKISWRLERTHADMNETEWNYYQSLPPEKKQRVVPIISFDKLSDGNSVLVQAAARTIQHPTVKQRAEAEKIIEALQVVHDHVARNFGYYRKQLRILDIDSPLKTMVTPSHRSVDNSHKEVRGN